MAGIGNHVGTAYVARPTTPVRKGCILVAADYDELHTEVKESQNDSLEALKSASAPDPNSVVRELDAADDMDSVGIPGGEFVAEELVVQIVPQRDDEFTCDSCFLVRHRSQMAREKDGHAYCIECEG
jgi:hypothetical protein